MSVPLRLLIEQRTMLKTLVSLLIKSKLLAYKRPKQNPATFDDVDSIVEPPSKLLLEHYLTWTGAPKNKYSQHIPAHLFCQFALPVCAQQLEKTRYDLSGIINQGCGLTIHQPISHKTKIGIICKMVEIREENGRARIHQRLDVSTEEKGLAYEVDFYTTLIIGKRSSKSQPSQTEPNYEQVGEWTASQKSGLEFGILTGDLNPIHWLKPIAKLSPFKGLVLHGFGMFVRSFELIENATDKKIKRIDVKFVSPVRLPSEHNFVSLAQPEIESDLQAIKLESAQGKTNMVGHCQFFQ